VDTADKQATAIRTPEQAVERMGKLVTVSTLEKWRVLGRGPKFVKIGRKIGYLDRDIDAFIARHVRSHTGETRETRRPAPEAA
jgi:predicted DNA-binding transcriptional regulator AlpA